jgi:hypothetical protein
MQEKPVTISGAKGVRNNVPEERLGKDELARGYNIDIDETGYLTRRRGTQRIVTTSAGHSLYSNGEYAFFVDGTSLKRLDKNLTTTTTLRSDLTANLRMKYVAIPGRVFYTNNLQTGCFDGVRNRSWGITVPGLPTVSESIGELPAGQYQYTMTYVRDDGQESGAPLQGYITIAANKGLSFSAIPQSSDTTVARKRIYISSVDSKVLYLAMEIANSATTAVYRGYREGVIPLLTQFRGPPIAASALAYYNGRIYFAVGQNLFYTEAYNYELVDYRSAFIPFSETITTVSASENGLFVGTENGTYYLSGGSAESLALKQCCDYGTVPGTEVELSPSHFAKGENSGIITGWMSKKGFCVGTPDGQVLNVSANTYNITAAKEGASMYKDSLTPQVVVSLFS